MHIDTFLEKFSQKVNSVSKFQRTFDLVKFKESKINYEELL